MESVTNIRTVASFSNEAKICEFYSEKLKKPYEVVVKKGNLSGVVILNKNVLYSFHLSIF